MITEKREIGVSDELNFGRNLLLLIVLKKIGVQLPQTLNST
jgi:hypothetical protein